MEGPSSKVASKKIVCHRYPHMMVCGCTIPCRKSQETLGDLSCLEIAPRIYLGPQEAAYMREKLHDIGVTHVLNIGAIEYYKDERLVYQSFQIEDHSDEKIYWYFERTNNFIEEAIQLYSKSNGKYGGVLVHCQAGVSRSPCITMAYLMWKFNLSFEHAFELVKSKRPNINPNEGFVTQLKEYQEVLKCKK